MAYCVCRDVVGEINLAAYKLLRSENMVNLGTGDVLEPDRSKKKTMTINARDTQKKKQSSDMKTMMDILKDIDFH